MNTDERVVLAGALEMRQRMSDGGLRKVGLGKPPYEPQERLLLRLRQLDTRRVPLTADRQEVERLGRLRTRGAVYATDRRAMLMGNFGKVVAQWWWHELTSVTVIHGWAGVRLVRPQDVDDSDAVLHVYRPAVLLDQGSRDVAVSLVQLEACYVLAVGRDFDAWLAALPARWAAA